VILRQRFHHLERTLLNAHSRLYPLHSVTSRSLHYVVHMYQCTHNEREPARVS
jgi:hypothetical protein